MFLYVTMSMRGIDGPILGDIRLIWTTFVVPLDGISALTLVFALPLSFMGIHLVEVEDGIYDEACELVNGVDISIGEGDDSILAYRFTAVKNNNGTGILLLSDILGFEDSSTRDFAYRVACNSYKYVS
ncbi:hypothetical protein TEA_009586 [Camellia sinensis var. sinensis]|uniref:Uncharacterized protein n=1 Tax=Camellia sinensis var. sinensis TaxID=542762 RepID=A0A4S4DWY6_CAMSN|nr:hypothetical protein TEA_009586 [Camellia sinensis var. sinensis]